MRAGEFAVDKFYSGRYNGYAEDHEDCMRIPNKELNDGKQIRTNRK